MCKNQCLSFQYKLFVRKVYIEVTELGPRYDVQDDSRGFPLSLSFRLLRFTSINSNRLSLVGF